MIEFRAVTFSFTRGDPLFCDFDLTIADKETTAVLGPSGCGKSTLLRLACGLLEPNGGNVRLRDGSAAHLGGIKGALFQDDTLIPWLDVLDNALFPRRPTDEDAPLAEALRRLAEVGLDNAFSKRPHELSAGMKKRLEFVRAWLGDERYILADEPFSGLDFHQKRALWSLWSSLMQARDRLGLILTHDIQEAIAPQSRRPV